ncbi:methyl-accepting chemotaxis protein [Simiduia sp. 21SJ11W-1]|uniref:methyl-accepting chemotaxis protein n=1 Tax=Simiduia sp. 21SJ11W-1 TaxID=2909669 RepID=UPI00209E9884|nr:methyl-accepting chemotaxis protein [Simiduia sp. 21SJ11W-1]UTA47208.1 methyl-accepting chemotaxis protein [Simiduia sp. 21SJ11W-1]
MTSLFLRMRLVHWVGIALLSVNALFFTDNTASLVIQGLLVVVLVIHDVDEKRWGVDALQQVGDYFQHFARKDLTVTCDVNTSLNAEMGEIVQTIDTFREQIQLAMSDIKRVAGANEAAAKHLSATGQTMGQRIRDEVAIVGRARAHMHEMHELTQSISQRAEQTNT